MKDEGVGCARVYGAHDDPVHTLQLAQLEY